MAMSGSFQDISQVAQPCPAFSCVKPLPSWARTRSARFRRQVVPGDELELHAELGRISARAGKGTGKALVNGEVACELDLMFVFG